MKIKPIKPRKWLDVNNWEFTNENNTSIPDSEKVPCDHDDVNIEYAANLIFPEVDTKVKSLSYELFTFFYSHGNSLGLSNTGMFNHYLDFDVTGENCTIKSGCVCHDNSKFESVLCANVQQKTPHCLEPIKPIGFCNSICGKYC